jgi:hypothetical protein
MLCAAVLLISLMAGGAAGTVPAAHAAVSAGASPGMARGAGNGAVPLGAEERALASARSAGHAVAVPADTTPTDSVAANPDGSLTLTQSTAPVRKWAGGSWKDLDSTLYRGEGGRISAAVTTAGVALSGDGSGPMATMTAAGRTISVSFPASFPSPLPAPAMSGSTVIYADVIPGVDLQVTVGVQGTVSDVVVVRSAAAAADPRLRSLELGVQAPGLKLGVGAAGDITLSGAGGHVVLATPTPFMWDSAAAPAGTPSATVNGVAVDAHTGNPLASSASGPGVGAGYVPVAVTAQDASIVLTPDQAMLTSPKTVFPVYIDPVFVPPDPAGTSRSGWETINDLFTTASNWDASELQVGDQAWEAPHFVARSFLKVPVSSKIYGSHIIDAQFNMHEIHAASCTATPVKLVLTGAISSSTTWSNPPSPNTNNGTLQDTQTVAHGWDTSCPEAGVGFDVSNAMQTAASVKWTQATFGLQAGNEGDPLGWKKFNSTGQLSVTFDHTPDRPTKTTMKTSPVTSCSAATVVGDGDVKLIVPISDPDGGTLGVRLQMWKTGTSTNFIGTPTDPNSSGFFGASGTNITFTAHKAALEAASGVTGSSPGVVTEFSWKAQVTDFYTGPTGTSDWSDTCNFKFDPTRPGPPSLPDDLSSYSFTIGQPTSVPLSPPQSGTLPASYQYQVDGGPPQTISAAVDGSATIAVTPTRFSNVLSVTGMSAAGNLGEQAVSPVFDATPGAPQADGDLTGDGSADLVTVGSAGMPPGLWLAPGRGDGSVVTQAVDFGANGNGTGTDYSPADFNGGQVITGHFNGSQFQDALVFYPSGVASDPSETLAQANILLGTGDGSAASGAPHPEQTIDGNDFLGSFGLPVQLANAGDTQGHLDQTTGLPSPLPWPDLLGTTTSGTLALYPNGDGFAAYGAVVDLSDTPPGDTTWNGWQMATAQVASGTALYLWNPGTGALYLRTGLRYVPADGTTPDHLSYTQYTIADGSATHWNQGAALALDAADINGDGTPDLWAVTASGVATASIATLGTGTATLAAQASQTLLSSTRTWPLTDSQATPDGGTDPSTATDTTGSPALPLTLSGNVQWNTGDLFDPDVALGLTADGDPGGSTGYLTTASSVVNPNNGGITVSAWANPAVLGGTVLSQDMTNTASFRLSSTASGTWEFCLAQSNVASPAWDCATGGSAQPGDWSQLTATYDPSTTVVNLFQGTVNIGHTAHTALTGITNSAFEVGAYHNGAAGARTGFFTGQVAQVQAWSRVIAPAEVSSPAGYFHPLTPARILDTRSTGQLPVNGGATGKVQVLGAGGIPSAGVIAVALNITVLNQAANSTLVIYPDQAPRPAFSDINSVTGTALANFKIVAPGPDGKVALFNSGSGAVDALVDVSGYFTADRGAAGAATFAPVNPTRILNTTHGQGAPQAPVTGGTSIAVQVGGANGIPSGITAVAIDAQALNSATDGFLEYYPDGTTRPTASGVQFHLGVTTAGTDIIPVAANGKIDIFTSQTTDIAADVEGYFTAGTSGEKFHAIGGTRIIDSRQHGGPLAAGGVLPVSGGTTVVAQGPALVANLVAIGGTAAGFLTAYAHATTRGTGTTLNYAASQVIDNLAITPTGAGAIDVFNGGTVAAQVVVDCSGYFSLG